MNDSNAWTVKTSDKWADGMVCGLACTFEPAEVKKTLLNFGVEALFNRWRGCCSDKKHTAECWDLNPRGADHQG